VSQRGRLGSQTLRPGHGPADSGRGPGGAGRGPFEPVKDRSIQVVDWPTRVMDQPTRVVDRAARVLDPSTRSRTGRSRSWTGWRGSSLSRTQQDAGTVRRRVPLSRLNRVGRCGALYLSVTCVEACFLHHAASFHADGPARPASSRALCCI